MKIKKTITKSNTTYCIIMDYKNLNGKRSTSVFEALGNDNDLINRFGKENTMDKVQEYIDSLNKTIKENKELPVKLLLDFILSLSKKIFVFITNCLKNCKNKSKKTIQKNNYNV